MLKTKNSGIKLWKKREKLFKTILKFEEMHKRHKGKLWADIKNNYFNRSGSSRGF